MTASQLASARNAPVAVWVAAPCGAQADSAVRNKPISTVPSDDSFGHVYLDPGLAHRAAMARRWGVFEAIVSPDPSKCALCGKPLPVDGCPCVAGLERVWPRGDQ